LTCANNLQLCLQRLDRADHIRHHVRAAILGRQLRDGGLDCERSSNFDTGFGVAASERKESQAYSFSELSTRVRETCMKLHGSLVMLSVEVAKAESKLEVGGGDSRQEPGSSDVLVFCSMNAACSHRQSMCFGVVFSGKVVFGPSRMAWKLILVSAEVYVRLRMANDVRGRCMQTCAQRCAPQQQQALTT
jgi:hypothetical protein